MRGGVEGKIGGIERQQALISKWFAAKGYPVTMLTWDEGGPAEEMIDGVRVLKICRQHTGLPGLRFLHPKWTSLNRALALADADLYYQNCGEVVTGQVALWCKRYGRRFVYSVASDPDCDPRLPEMNLRERVLYRYGLRKADRVIVQTRRQKKMLKEGFGLDAEVIPMPCAGPDEHLYSAPFAPQPGSARVLWVGRVCQVKRPDRLVEVARACSDVQFDMVGPIYGDAYTQEMRRRAEATPNIRFHGPVALAQVGRYYRRASLLLCTSDYEGFPNTFLEALSYGLPIVSTFDPDNLIIEKGLGKVGKDICELADGIRELLDSSAKWLKVSQSAREYYLENHMVDKVMGRFERVFCDFVDIAGDNGDGDCV